MAAIDQIVTVNITSQTTAVQQDSFSIPLIIGSTQPGWAPNDYVHTYTAPSEMLSDGYTTASPEYAYAVAMFSGVLAPSQFKVGLRATGSGDSIATDLANIQTQDDTWYGVVLAGGSDADILALAQAIEPLHKIYLAFSSDAAILSASSTSDVYATLKQHGYARTVPCFSSQNPNGGFDAAWMGLMLPTTPGASNWAFKNLPGVAVDTLTPTQQTTLIGSPNQGIAGKNVNIYQRVGGVGITQMGTAAQGNFIDLIIGSDWMTSTIKANAFGFLVNLPKIPYTDKGVAVLESAVRAALDLGVANGLLDGDSPIVVTAPSVLTVSANQRASRVAPSISFSARFAGALNGVVFSGVLSA